MGNVKKNVAPIVGMTFFWAYFRYQAVFGTLYPLGSEVSDTVSSFTPCFSSKRLF